MMAKSKQVKFHVQCLDGYTDGRESWLTVARCGSRDFAETTLHEISGRHPKWKMRIRKITR
jgi:hypothetical protein